jgi:hypothetical protein
MSQFNAPVRRTGGEIDVYTALLGVAFLVLLGGVVLLAVRNLDHSRIGTESGGPFKLVAR